MSVAEIIQLVLVTAGLPAIALAFWWIQRR
jgi:hypothetical protein